ncbi:response regulator [candidate division KSB1 bacterium]|nr:response regulator [candidate division KSB1 bacterium]
MEKRRILVVDDEMEVCILVKEFLEERGYQVAVANRGKDAVEGMKSFRPHVVLLDIRMPGMSGMEVLDQIREIDKEVGVIMVTAVKDERIGREALKKGATDYIVKPIDLDYLETSVLTKITQTW